MSFPGGPQEGTPAPNSSSTATFIELVRLGLSLLETMASSGLVVNSEFPAAATMANAMANPTTTNVAAMMALFNGTTWDCWLEMVNGMNTTGTGVAATGMLCQFDDVSPGVITENRFGPARMSSRREVYAQVRDAAGNERGQNVNANSAAMVAFDQATPGITNGVVVPGQLNEIAPTTDGAYAANDIVGGILSFTTINAASGRPVRLKSIQINDKGNNSAALFIQFFKATPSGGTYTNNGPVTWGTGDSANRVGQVTIGATDWQSIGSQCSVNLGGDEVLGVGATTLFALVFATGAPTFAAGDLTIKLGVEHL